MHDAPVPAEAKSHEKGRCYTQCDCHICHFLNESVQPVPFHRWYITNLTFAFPGTYVNASPQDLLASILVPDEILHPVDVVQPQGNGRNKPFHGDVNGKPEILLQEGTSQSSHRLGVLEIQAERYKQRLRVPAPSRSPHAGGGLTLTRSHTLTLTLTHTRCSAAAPRPGPARPGLPRLP